MHSLPSAPVLCIPQYLGGAGLLTREYKATLAELMPLLETLHDAAMDGDIQAVERLIEAKCDVNKTDMRPLPKMHPRT
eukprot:407535-Rhodomonas_salina.4